MIDRWVCELGRAPAVGVDEAGRGPLAGPVVAAAVVFSEAVLFDLPADLRTLNDSKALSPSVREDLVPAIRANAAAVGLASVGPATIDRINVLEATRLAMRLAVCRAARALGARPRIALVDGHLAIPELMIGGRALEQRALVRGDSRSLAIAAASVLAKVSRDAFMVALDERCPGYGFSQHKGYGTLAHRRAMAALGLSGAHRRSFRWAVPD